MKEVVVRSISGVVFVAVIIASLLLSPFTYLAVFAVVVALVMSEYLRLTIGEGKFFLRVVAIAAGVLLFALSFFVLGLGWNPICLLAVAALIILLPIINLYSNNYNGIGNAFASIVYIALPFALLNFVAFPRYWSGVYNGWTTASMFIILWSSDVGAYCFGTLFGQGERGHKLFPSISPKKSWEGIIGGAITAGIAAAVLGYAGVLNFSIIGDIVFTLLIFVAGVYGDLVESQLKRNFGVKDSGAIMPGHGGMLDRFDSALLAFPAAVIFTLLVWG
ncbi:MAG: phosphatidate cytidylyltransferase [Bacteroidales bacterium]|jgi:phosphatidate cytidylyltransferase|nr:phosphatidate cytidylyltransferase [Bacteroidales bacterium]MCI1733320.1 phosphatidate cytidylyltransferase [Bacteroidales bacterium]